MVLCSDCCVLMVLVSDILNSSDFRTAVLVLQVFILRVFVISDEWPLLHMTCSKFGLLAYLIVELCNSSSAICCQGKAPDSTRGCGTSTGNTLLGLAGATFDGL